MNECDVQLLGALHDGELAAADRCRVEQHVLGCPACARELEALRLVSKALQDDSSAELSQGQLDRLHAAIDASADRPILRLFATISALAASLLIVCGAWLAEPGRRGVQVAAESGESYVGAVEPWERVAMTLRPDPIDRATGPSVALADASLAEWMLQGITTEKSQ